LEPTARLLEQAPDLRRPERLDLLPDPPTSRPPKRPRPRRPIVIGKQRRHHLPRHRRPDGPERRPERLLGRRAPPLETHGVELAEGQIWIELRHGKMRA